MCKNKIMVIASAGGHLSQALAAVSVVNGKVILTNRQGIAKLNSLDSEHRVFDTTYNIFFHFLNFLLAIRIFYKYHIRSIFTTGGPVCLPFLLLGKVLKIKIVYMDTMSRVNDLSNTGKFVYKFRLFDVFIVQWEEVKAKYEGVSFYGQIFNIYNDRDA